MDNVQKGEDDCGTYHVSWDKLRELLSVCEKVVQSAELIDGTVYVGTLYDDEHPHGLVKRAPGKVLKDYTVAKGLLPCRFGAFFGPVEYDVYYLSDVERTRDWIVSMLTDHEKGTPGDIYYSSSW